MKRYIIQMERNGIMIPVGEIRGEDWEEAVFSYLRSYLDRTETVPVSLSILRIW